MPKFSVTRRVPFSADQVFAVASDVANYRHFLPLVRRSVVRGESVLPDGRKAFDAELGIVYRKLGIQETMMSRVTADAANHIVTAESAEGPVQHLIAEWKLTEVAPNACEVLFSVDYALKSRSLQFVLSGMFDMIVRKIMSAFEERTRALYGARAAIR